jgi:UTP:GlnB (protein PII) uridylyltransferase
LTDVLSGRELVEKAFNYMTTLTKECRKVLTVQFQHKYKGVPFDSVEPTMRQEIESWFAKRDKNITVKHEKSMNGRPGELLVTYSGETKDAHFKFHVNSLFTLAGSSKNAPSYLRDMNIYVDKREFTR